MNIVGYSDPLSIAPGERLRLMASTRSSSFAASVARIAGAGGPAVIETHIDGTYSGRDQKLRPGSCVVVDDPPPLAPGEGFTLEVWVWPTAPGAHPQIVAGRHDGARGYALGIDDLGRAALWLDGEVTATGEPLQRRAWYRVEASYDAASGSARITQEPLAEWPGAVETEAAERSVAGWGEPAAPFRLGAWGEPASAHYNGKIEAPKLVAADGSMLAEWDMGGDFASNRVADASDGGRDGRCVNLPMRAVTGRGWRGRMTDPTLAPNEYAAIWFHDDDLDDAGWQPSFELSAPDDLSSGVYVIRLSTDDGEDEVPFFVRPPRGRRCADVVVLMPTLSYLAYGHEPKSWAHTIPATPRLDQILASVGERDRYVADARLKSIYELHTDGSGVAYSSRLRPVANMRSDYGMPLLLGGPHQFPADMELLEWLDQREIAYDVVTDEDLHHEGAQLLDGYRVLLTGSHPEYWTEAMLDGLEAWLDAGGRLMYLGGNGFYWVTSLFSDRPHVLEVRRGHAGNGVWRSDPGEVHHASTGEPGRTLALPWTPAATRCGSRLHRARLRPLASVPVGRGSARSTRRLDFRRRRRRRDRRARLRTTRRRRLRTRSRRHGTWDAPSRLSGRNCTRLQRRLPRDIRGHPHRGLAAGRNGQPAGARRHGLLRTAERRRGLLDRVDRVVRRAAR
jgi:N,N-dimethylformamidase